MNTQTGINKWRALDGDNTLALDWPLNEDSHVWEIGGFDGRWVQQIWDKFHCHITVFEPQLWAVEKMRERFAGNVKIEIRPYGLWTENGDFQIGDYGNDGASLLKGYHSMDVAHFKDVYNEINEFDYSINLALMNVEGAEYTLIPALVESRLMLRFEYFWCQFHPDLTASWYIPSGAIFDMISKSHDLLWDCYPTAVAWKRR